MREAPESDADVLRSVGIPPFDVEKYREQVQREVRINAFPEPLREAMRRKLLEETEAED